MANERAPEKPDEKLIQAAARVLLRHHHPDWRMVGDEVLDAWGHGYITGHRQGYLDGRGQ